jgi:hypothetical protein
MANSNIILPVTAYSSNTPQPVTGDKFKGGGFYSKANGLHTVQWNLYNFVGTIGIQATLAIDPLESDWFLVNLGNDTLVIDTTGAASKYTSNKFEYPISTNGVYGSNFSGNYVWIRAYITDWSAGNINSIILSH